MAKASYKLSRELVGHTNDVRALAVDPDGNIISASRDKTAVLWKFLDGNYVGNVTMTGHSHFVSAVCFIKQSQKHPKGLIVTGSHDSHIFIYNPGETQPLHKVKAHENTVCSLQTSYVDENSFITSSWDITAKLWNLDNLTKPKMTFLGHTLAVWCATDLPNGSVVTGSADKTVIVYLRSGEVLHKLEGHTDCVRSIAVINENEFLSCANDAIIKHWSAITGDCLQNFYGHSNYIYGLAALPGENLVVSSGEDRTIRVWNNGEAHQTITLPAQSVWSIKLLPNKDIVCGSSDGYVRIFTTNPARFADSETIKRFEELVEANATKDLGDIKMENLPDQNALQQPGNKDGDIKVIKEGSIAKAYSWSQADLKWNLVGDVTGSNSSNSEKQLYNGIEYDYVFSVDIQDGVPPLKLPYNANQDPWHVAQKFIDDNGLSQYYLEQVANFIIKNSTAAPVVSNAPQFYDPFTGGNRYIPAGGTENAQPVTQTVTHKYIPIKNYLKLEQANLIAICEKLKELNSKKEIGTHSIPEDQLEQVAKLAVKENSAIDETKSISILLTLLSWPDLFVFPVLDIARLAVLNETVNNKICNEELLNLIQRHLKSDAKASNQMLTFRLLANMFCYKTGEMLCLKHKNSFLGKLMELSTFGNKNHQVAVSTFILNLALATKRNDSTTGKIEMVKFIGNIINYFDEPEAVFRVFVALGTILTDCANEHELKELVNAFRSFERAVDALRTASQSTDAENKLTCVSKEILGLIF